MVDATQDLVDEARRQARVLIRTGHGVEGRTLYERLADALEAAQRPPVSKDDPIPRYAQLDVWMALFGAERSEEYGPFREEHGHAETWAWLLAQVRQPPIGSEQREALPVVAHKGPDDTDESMFLTAADNLERGYPLGGGNLTRAVVELIRREVERARFSVPSKRQEAE